MKSRSILFDAECPSFCVGNDLSQLLICKGAVEEVLEICTQTGDENSQKLLTDRSGNGLNHFETISTLRPRKWDAPGLYRFMIWIGPISSVFDVTTFYLLWHAFGANSAAHQSLFQSGWFVEGLLFANADRAHDPHTEDPFPSKPGSYACAASDGHNYVDRACNSVHLVRSRYRTATASHSLFCVVGCDADLLPGSPTREVLVSSQV
jgi:hypothetical protein